MDAEVIAEACHEANRVLTGAIQDVPVQSAWWLAPVEMKASAIAGVRWRLANPYAPASAQHEEWMRSKLAAGWTRGKVRDEEKKTHPALVPYDQLPAGVQMKDKLFTAIVLALQ